MLLIYEVDTASRTFLVACTIYIFFFFSYHIIWLISYHIILLAQPSLCNNSSILSLFPCFFRTRRLLNRIFSATPLTSSGAVDIGSCMGRDSSPWGVGEKDWCSGDKDTLFLNARLHRDTLLAKKYFSYKYFTWKITAKWYAVGVIREGLPVDPGSRIIWNGTSG